MKRFFLSPNRNMSAGKFVKLKRHIIFNVKWVEVCKIAERNYIVKCAIFFGSFCWLWEFLLENRKFKKNSSDVNWKVWTNIKTLYARSNIFKKGIPNMGFWIINILVHFGSPSAKHGGRHFTYIYRIKTLKFSRQFGLQG